MKYQQNSEECTICKCETNEESESLITFDKYTSKSRFFSINYYGCKCKMVYHPSCLENWFKTMKFIKKCPVCKKVAHNDIINSQSPNPDRYATTSDSFVDKSFVKILNCVELMIIFRFLHSDMNETHGFIIALNLLLFLICCFVITIVLILPYMIFKIIRNNVINNEMIYLFCQSSFVVTLRDIFTF